jgi:hypothetical protein
VNSQARGRIGQHHEIAYCIERSLSSFLLELYEKYGGRPRRVGVSLDARRCRREALWSAARQLTGSCFCVSSLLEALP